ncbi:NADPH-dependent thioredoxin reductase 3, partial [Zea mays]
AHADEERTIKGRGVSGDLAIHFHPTIRGGSVTVGGASASPDASVEFLGKEKLPVRCRRRRRRRGEGIGYGFGRTRIPTCGGFVRLQARVSGRFHLQTLHCTARTTLGTFKSANIAEI